MALPQTRFGRRVPTGRHLFATIDQAHDGLALVHRPSSVILAAAMRSSGDEDDDQLARDR
jgi:hypothetical protein